ncbi:hypothetical protein [Methylobacterium aquaticum]|uniref:BLUF domain protein n=1 Tax=Methylobacterium aquaticum TaxID=270351 RepID=A0A0C6FBC2_9HYPH|nr:hypothetical protein [Methylobacterium aquaticum]BAQ50041.1 BLUF domain protein [Methylobacterium aquaticum]
MIAAQLHPYAATVIAALAEELVFALTPDLLAEQYRKLSTALDQLAAAKVFLENRYHPVGPDTREVVEIAQAQGGSAQA